MKLILMFKTPDVIKNALDFSDSIDEEKLEEIKKILEKFVEYGEYCTIEVDIDKKTAKVIPVKR